MTAGQLLRERGRVIKRKREREHEVLFLYTCTHCISMHYYEHFNIIIIILLLLCGLRSIVLSVGQIKSVCVCVCVMTVLWVLWFSYQTLTHMFYNPPLIL